MASYNLTMNANSEETSSDIASGPPPSASDRGLALLQGAGLVALALTGYLSWLGLTGEVAAGCGGGGPADCEYVLSSRWAWWLTFPVSVPAVSLWLAVLVASLFAGATSPDNVRRVVSLGLIALTTAAVVAAVWFFWLQATELGHYCLYCLGAHACALAAWLGALLRPQTAPHSRWLGLAAGMTLGALIPIGQIVWPPPPLYRIDRVEEVADANPLRLGQGETSDGPQMSLLGGKAQVELENVPHIGAADAPLVVVKLFDYACFHCREMHHQLREAQEASGGKLTIVLLPTPASNECNPLISKDATTSPDACELARLALIVWHLAPEQFEAFDRWLFEPVEARTYADARAHVVTLIGEEALKEAESDPRYARQIAQHVDLYAESPARLLPQVMGKGVVVSGQFESVRELLRVLEAEFDLSR